MRGRGAGGAPVLERGGLEWRLPAGWREADPPHVLTDRAPGPGEFEGLMQGVVVYGERHVSFTLLTHPPHTAAREAARALLRGARRSHARR